MKNVDEGPIYNSRIRKGRREDIKEDNHKKEKKLIESRENLPEGHFDFTKMYKGLENLQIKIDNFNREAEDLLQKNREEIRLIYNKSQVKYEEISKKFNEDTKKLLDEFDVKRKELEKLVKDDNVSKFTDKMKKLYEEMQKKWEECKQEYEDNEKKVKEQEEKEIKKNNKEYNLRLIELKKKYNLK